MENRSANSTVQLSMEQQSLQALEKNLIPNAVTLVILCIMLANSLLLLKIFYTGRKTFNSVHYKLMAQSFLGVAFHTVGYMFWPAIPYLVYGILKTPCTMTILTCSFFTLPFELTSGVDYYTLFMVSVDRLLAVSIPQYYNTTLDKRKLYSYIMLGIPWIGQLMEALVKYALLTSDVLRQETPLCSNKVTRPVAIDTYKSNSRSVLAASTMVFFIATVVVVKYRIYKSPFQTVQETKAKIGYRVVITSVIDGTIFCCSDFSKSIFGQVINSYLKSSTLSFVNPTFVLTGLTSRLIVLLIRNENFRSIAKNILKSSSSTVSVQPVKLHVLSQKKSTV